MIENVQISNYEQERPKLYFYASQDFINTDVENVVGFLNWNFIKRGLNLDTYVKELHQLLQQYFAQLIHRRPFLDISGFGITVNNEFDSYRFSINIFFMVNCGFEKFTINRTVNSDLSDAVIIAQQNVDNQVDEMIKKYRK